MDLLQFHIHVGFHTGIDIVSQETDKTIYSVCSGTVVATGYLISALGNEVLIQGDNGYFWRYCHMVDGSILVSEGQQVTTSTPLGTMGATGRVTGAHLHLEASTTSSWICNNFVSPGPIIGIPNVDNTIIYYDGSQPEPTPPGPTPSEDTPIGPIYHRNFNNKWFYSTAPGYTATITSSSQKQENAKYIWNYLKTYGWTLESASVVIGAMDLVSSLNSAWRPTTSSESDFGLLGWRFWEFQNWVDAGGEWVADSDYTIIDNSIGRICWYRQYNLAWDSETYTLQIFSESTESIETLCNNWILYYVYNKITDVKDLINKANYWFDYLSGNLKNNWKYLYSKRYIIN